MDNDISEDIFLLRRVFKEEGFIMHMVDIICFLIQYIYSKKILIIDLAYYKIKIILL